MRLELKKINKEFEVFNFFKKEKQIVLEDINLTLEDGDILGLIGKNGAGKTTLLKIITGLIEPSGGEIIFDKKNAPLFGYANSNSRSFFWRISTRENLIFFSRMLGLNNFEIKKTIENVSDILEINHILDKPFMHLSSGQMQSVNIARSLLKKPDILLLDEPTTSLDYESSINIMNKLCKYLNHHKIPAIWCSHNYFELNRVCNRFAHLKDKRIKNGEKKIFDFHQRAINYEFEVKQEDLEKITSKHKISLRKNDGKKCYFSLENSDLYLNDVLKIFYDSDVHVLSIEKNFKLFKDYLS